MSPSTRLIPANITRSLSNHLRSTSPTSIRTYYSIHHPDSAPFPEIQNSILSSALIHVPVHGFTKESLNLGLRDTSYLESSIQLFPRGSYDLINYYLVTQRLALKTRVQFPTTSDSPTNPSLTQKIKSLLWARLSANIDAGVIPHWQDALGQMSLLEHLRPSLSELGSLSDEIWYLAGDTAVDFSWYTKRAQLAAVYASAEVYMTTDTSEGYVETREFLDRRLEDVLGVGRVVGGSLGYAGWWAANGLGLARAWGMRV